MSGFILETLTYGIQKSLNTNVVPNRSEVRHGRNEDLSRARVAQFRRDVSARAPPDGAAQGTGPQAKQRHLGSTPTQEVRPTFRNSENLSTERSAVK